MTAPCYNLHGTMILECPPDGKKLRSDRDAVELIGEAFQRGARLILIPVERLDEDFFRLRTRIAGEMVQKFVNYRMRLVIAGDIAQYVAESDAFRDFVYEANRGSQIWFVTNVEEL